MRCSLTGMCVGVSVSLFAAELVKPPIQRTGLGRRPVARLAGCLAARRLERELILARDQYLAVTGPS
jgi:hypothetical protein